MSNIVTFLDVYDAGSFAAVAKTRNVAPSTVSRSIAALEKEIGVSLFDRTTRRLSPTEEGDILEARVRRLSADLQDTASRLRDIGRSPSGTIRVSASVSYGQEVIARLLPSFHASFPDVRIDLLLSDRQVDLVRDKIDVAFRHGRLADSSHKASKLTDVHYSVVATPGYLTRYGTPTHPEQLEDHTVLSFALEDFRHAWIFESPDSVLSEVPINPVLTVSGALALRQCVLGGMGLALLPNWAITDTGFVRVLTEWRVTGAHFDRAIWLVLPDRSYRAKRVEAFINHVRSNMV